MGRTCSEDVAQEVTGPRLPPERFETAFDSVTGAGKPTSDLPATAVEIPFQGCRCAPSRSKEREDAEKEKRAGPGFHWKYILGLRHRHATKSI